MFVRCAANSVPLTATAVAEPRNSLCQATSLGRFRLRQLTPITPAEFEKRLDALNTYFDGALQLHPMWSLDATSGGGVECRVRNKRTVPGKKSLRIMFNFHVWHPEAHALDLKRSPIESVRERRESHTITFQSDASIVPWGEHDMILATAGICAAFNWIPVGGIRLRKVAERADHIKANLGGKTCRFPILKRASFTSPTSYCAKPLATLWEWCQDRQQEETK